MRNDIEVKAAVGLVALAALLAGATTAHADPGVPIPPLPPVVPAAGDAAVPVAAVAAPPTEVPHLVSPENLPPGTSITPVGPRAGTAGSYLRELWHAVQTQEVSGKDALLLLTQRPLNANATPHAGLAPLPAQPMPAGPPPPPGDPLPPVPPPPTSPPPAG